jgi:hypothetical protein
LQATAPRFAIKQVAVWEGFERRGPLRPIAIEREILSILASVTCIPNGRSTLTISLRRKREI